METLQTGMKAYFDSFAGLIPCRVESITGQSGICSTAQRVTATLTSRKRRGEKVECYALHIVPRESVRRSKYGSRIRSYMVEVG